MEKYIMINYDEYKELEDKLEEYKQIIKDIYFNAIDLENAKEIISCMNDNKQYKIWI